MLTFDLNINKGILIARGIHCTKFRNFPAKDIELTLFSNTNNLTLSFDNVTWKLVGVISSLGVHCNKFGIFQVKGSINCADIFQSPAVWPLTMWPENIEGISISYGIYCTMFSNFQAKRSKDSVQTDRPIGA